MPAPRKATPLNLGTRGEMHSVRVALGPAGSGIPQAQGRAAEASGAAGMTAGGGSVSGPRRLRQPGEARLWWSRSSEKWEKAFTTLGFMRHNNWN